MAYFFALITMLYALIGSAPIASAYYCPETRKEWSDWRDQSLRNLSSPEDLGSDRFQLIEKCEKYPDQKKLFQDPQLAACLAPLKQSSAAIRNGTHNEGALFDSKARIMTNGVLQIPAKQYAQKSRLPSPDALTPPKDFMESEAMKALRGGKTWAQIRTAMGQLQARFPGIHGLTLQDPFIGGPPSIVVVIPQKGFDQYIHFLGPQDPSPLMLAIQKKDDTGNDLDPPKSFFAFTGDVTLPPAQGIHGFLNDLMTGDPQVGRCIGCHRVGGMPLVPRNMATVHSLTPGVDDAAALDWINQRIGSTANARPDSADLSVFGPPLGEINAPTRTDAFIQGCAKGTGADLSSDGINRIRKAMNCSACHSGERAGVLNFPVGPKDIFRGGSIFEWMVSSGHMPPGNKLSPETRKALAQCLEAEYYGGFSDPTWKGAKEPGTFLRWLKGISCYDPKTLTPHEKSSAFNILSGKVILPEAGVAK